GLSWKQKHETLYPNSASDAAAEPPARPVPTTITEYFRLFAGLTSFMSNLCFVHFSAIGPEGTCDFNSTGTRSSLLYDSGVNCQRNGNKPEHDHERENRREPTPE